MVDISFTAGPGGVTDSETSFPGARSLLQLTVKGMDPEWDLSYGCHFPCESAQYLSLRSMVCSKSSGLIPVSILFKEKVW